MQRCALSFLTRVGLICLIGVLANYGFTLIMATISQDSLRSLRNQLFARMQKLPVRYFDTHQHGDTMSIYTNDIDALRQAIEQSIPQLLSSAIMILGVTITMLTVSPLLFLIVLIMVIVMFFIIKDVSGKSGRYFGAQQKNLGIENGFIEEMMSGQKVVKAFVHETESIEDFDRINDQLFESSYQANRYANSWEPRKCFLCSDILDRGDHCPKWHRWFNHWWSHGLLAIEPFLHGSHCPGLSTIELCPDGLGWWRSYL